MFSKLKSTPLPNMPLISWIRKDTHDWSVLVDRRETEGLLVSAVGSKKWKSEAGFAPRNRAGPACPAHSL